MCIYAAHLIFRVRKWDPPMVRKPFSVRVMIPCYKEDIETLEETVECAIEAAKAAMAKGQANAGALPNICLGCMIMSIINYRKLQAGQPVLGSY